MASAITCGALSTKTIHARYPGAESTEQKGSEKVVPHVAEGLAVHAAGHQDGQVKELQGGEARDPARGGASPESLSQEPV
jgi:hypothetical protein